MAIPFQPASRNAQKQTLEAVNPPYAMLVKFKDPSGPAYEEKENDMIPSQGFSRERPGKKSRLLLLWVILIAAALIITGCGQESPQPAAPPEVVQVEEPPAASEPDPAPAPTDAPIAAVVPSESQTESEAVEESEPAEESEVAAQVEEDPEFQSKIALAQALWDEGPHGNTYDLGKGPNTYCSRCHSPQNWDPMATTGPPPNCVTCKFPTDPELRIAPTMDFVSEEDWLGIGCETCHVTIDGNLQPELAWFNPLTEEHEPVNTPTELCQKCHVTTQGVSATGGRGVTHGITLGGSAHANWAGALPQAPRPQYCSDCHNPHSTQPAQCVDCHESVLELDTHIKGQNEAHANVTCLACHDAEGWMSGPHPDEDMGGIWVTLETSVSRTGETVTSYIKSHSIQWQVDCTRCHFDGNSWDLIILNADGTLPEPSSD
jgi:hypothetical protein